MKENTNSKKRLKTTVAYISFQHLRFFSGLSVQSGNTSTLSSMGTLFHVIHFQVKFSPIFVLKKEKI